MNLLQDYDREAAVWYAHRWAYGRNPAFYDYETIGGDCTNFASQCLYAGGGVMNYFPTYGWYYINANQKAPAWTGVEYLFNFLTRPQSSVGPVGVECQLWELLPGDLVQLSLGGNRYQHSPVVVEAQPPYGPENILVAAHSFDADNRPLNSYEYVLVRPVKILGVNRP
ncbi:amidase domain-containing protein [Oscillibacter sp.]|uniref:amidase domain-containing protein n=1 Tax=Oscillibacter sp. TaxID=1945593 RepID=UPI0028A97D84|nr:amidase domain-containing protein [Oscillibacter sp.]